MRFVAGLMVLGFFSLWVRSADNLPHGFTKHGEVWTIRYVGVADADPTNDAVTFCAFKRVDVRKDIQGRELAKTLMHELLHVLACDGEFKQDQKWNNSGDKEDGQDGHAGIYWASEELLAFMQDNPQIVQFLVTTK